MNIEDNTETILERAFELQGDLFSRVVVASNGDASKALAYYENQIFLLSKNPEFLDFLANKSAFNNIVIKFANLRSDEEMWKKIENYNRTGETPAITDLFSLLAIIKE